MYSHTPRTHTHTHTPHTHTTHACRVLFTLYHIFAYNTHNSDAAQRHVLFIVCCAPATAAVVYAALLIPETLPVAELTMEAHCNEDEYAMKVVERKSVCERLARAADPIAPFRLLKRSRLMFWVSAAMFLFSIPENGVLEIALAFADDTLMLTQQELPRFNALFLLTFGACSVFVQTVLLGLLKRCLSEESILAVAVLVNSIHMLGYASLKFFPYEGTMFAVASFASILYLASPAALAIVSKNMVSSMTVLGECERN